MTKSMGDSDHEDVNDSMKPAPSEMHFERPGGIRLSGFKTDGISYVSIPTVKADHAHHILFKGVIVGTREIHDLGSKDDKGRAQFQIKVLVDTETLTSRTHFKGPDDMDYAHRFLERLFQQLDPAGD